MPSTLNNMARFAARWLLPRGVADLLNSAATTGRRGPRGAVDRALLRRNDFLRDLYKGRRCFILATGPSIRTQDLKPLAGELCIGVNQFYLHEDIGVIDPALHVAAPTHEPFDFAMTDEVLEGARRRLSPDCNIFLGCTDYAYSFHKAVARHADFAMEDFHYLDYDGYPALDSYNYRDAALWDITASPFAPRTVIYCAVQLAAWAGCSEIYLLGCDHDYLHDMKRVTNHHFYAEGKGISDAEHLSAFTTETWFREYYLRWMQYRLMREALAARGVRIYNATAGGMLDVFERVNYEAVVRTIAAEAGEG